MAWKGNRLFTALTICYWIIFCVAFNSYGYTAGLGLSVLIVLLYIFMPLEKQWLFAFSALPFMGAFKMAAGLPSTSIILYVIFVIKSFILSHRLKRRFCVQLFVLFLIQLILMIFYGQSIISLISLIVNLVFMNQASSVINGINNEYGSKKDVFLTMTLVYVMAVTVMSLMSNIFPNMSSMVSSVDQSFFIDGTLTARYSGIAGDPNYYTQLIMVGIAMALSSIIVCKTGALKKCLLIACVVYLVSCGVLTYSKSFYVTLALCAVIMLWYVYIRSVNNKILLVLLIIAAPGVIYLLYYFTMNFILPGILQRVTSDVDLTSGRTEIWASYLKMLIHNPLTFLFGAGVNNAKNLIVPYYGQAQAAHNAFLELLSDTGLIGCILLFHMYKGGLKAAAASWKNPMSAFFLIFVITSFSLSFSAYDTVYFVIPMLYLLDDREGHAYTEE